MRKWKALCVLAFFLIGSVRAQTVEELKRQVDALRTAMTEQRAAFQKQIRDLQGRISATLEDELEGRIDDIVATKAMFYSRPREGSTEQRFLFDTLQGGLIFTGLFRSRMEFRQGNIDFSTKDSGLDDEGVRINGRFRLGFGAVLLGSQTGEARDEQISVLTEFQSVGTFANNSFVNIPGPGGVPLPTAFNILTEPFEEVALYQGYLHFERVLGENIYIKAGRQEITQGSEFILGNNSFADGTVHDALLVEWASGETRLSAFYTKQAASDQNLVTGISDFDEDQMYGVYLTVQAMKDLALEAYALYFDARSIDTDLFVTGSTAFFLDGAVNPVLLGHFWTLGARAFLTRLNFFGGLLSLNGEAAFQFGSNLLEASPATSVTRQSIHGWGVEFIANWRVSPGEGLKPIVTVAYYYAGGGEKNSDGGSGFPPKAIGFQPMFINRHFDVRNRDDLSRPYFPGGGRYGNMDVIPLSNVHLAKAAITIAPTQKTELGIAYILAVTADDEGVGTGIFGHEIDVFGSYQYNENIQFAANLSVFFPGDTAKDLSQLLFFDPAIGGKAGAEIAVAFYLQALITF